MNALLLRNLGGLRRTSSLQSFAEYRQAEAQNPGLSSVTSEGTLLEYETLELRIHPPNVVIDNETYDDVTVITIDSANRPGTLIEVVQCLTELGLSIRCARISSDGGWFVDEFFVTETPRGKMLDQRKMNIIRKVLSVETDSAGNLKEKELCTVFELAGRDRHGLLAAVLQLLVVNGCEVLSAAVWTFHDRVALVISATERGAPVVDPIKLDRLEQILYDMLGGGDAVVNSELVRGEVHHERRLHHLLLLEELKAWEQQYLAQAITPTHGASTQASQTGIQGGLAAEGSAGQLADAGGPACVSGASFGRTSAPGAASGLPLRAPSPAPAYVVAAAAAAAVGPPGGSVMPSRAPSPAPPYAAALQAEGSGRGLGAAYTSAGFPQADEGGAACPAAASGGGPDEWAAAPAGPFDRLSLGRDPSADGVAMAAAALGGGGGGTGLGMAVSEPHIDVGLDLPAAVQLAVQDLPGGAAAAAAMVSSALDRRRSTAGPGDAAHMAAVAAALAQQQQQQPASPSGAAAATVAAAEAAGGGGGARGGGGMERSISSGALRVPSSSGGAGPGGGGTGPSLLPHRAPSNRTMTVTGDEQATGQPAPAPAPTAAPPSLGGASSDPTPGAPATAADQLAQLRRSEVRIQHSALLNYWLVTIHCRDRNKLFFDTVCTLADMNYDIYHATIDSEGDEASQLFYVRPRYGECIWDERRASKLRYMLESAVQRRFPRGTKVCVQSVDRAALVALFSALSSGGFWITRADVRTYHDSAVFEFTITDTRGQLPEQSHVQRICEAVGGTMVHDVYGPSQGPPSAAGSGSRLAGGASGRNAPGVSQPAGTFRFSILERRWNKGWGGSQAGGGAQAGSYDSTPSGSM